MSLGGRELSGGHLGRPKDRPGMKFERELQRDLKKHNARRQPASGAFPGKKGDIELAAPESYLLSLKDTTSLSLTITAAWLREITGWARGRRKTPAFCFSFSEASGPWPKKWIAIPADSFDALLTRAGANAEEET